MTNRRRGLMHRVMNGDQRVVPFLHYLDSWRRCDEMLQWLVRNHLTGKEFILWTQFNFGASMLSMAQYITRRLEKDSEGRPTLLGRDVLTH